MATVDYSDISKRFGTVEVIRDLSLTIREGEFAVLLGSSGCGKTTLLRMTAGLETISGGVLSIDGQRMNEVHPRDRNIAMVFQNYALYPTMKVFENIAFSLEVKGVAKDRIRARVEEAAAVLNLTEYLDRYPRELSGGQRQRVAMGRAMVREPRLFLFDEPLSNLDAKLRAHMRVEIRQLHDRLGTTTIYVTHDQIEAMTMADKIVLMKDGRIEQVGTPDDLYDHPETLYVADFVGSPSMNFIEGEVQAEEGAPVFVAKDVRLSLPASTTAAVGTQVACGLRPTDLAIDPEGGLFGALILSERTGAELNLHLDIAGHDIVATAPRDTQIEAGAACRLSIDPQKIHLFDRGTGKRC
ncbi:MAG: sn-glycerol-3-phosphate ABC transporter ATP-binding protein UgpC [Pseudomonadota bacterium]